MRKLILALALLLVPATADAGRGFNRNFRPVGGWNGPYAHYYSNYQPTTFWYSGVTPWGASYGFVSGGYQPPVYVMPVYQPIPVFYQPWGFYRTW